MPNLPHARLAPHRRDLRSCIRPSPPWPLCSYDAPFNRRPGPQFQQRDFHALTRSSRYAYSSHVHVLVCLLCVVPFVVADVRFHCAAVVSFRAVVLCGVVSCYHGVCVPLCCAVVCFCCRRVVLSFGFVQLCGAVVWFGFVSCRRVVSCRRFRAMVSCGAVVRFC